MLVITARARPFELMQKPNKLEYVEEVDLKISPMQAKLLAAWLLSNLKEYERLFGRIKSEEEIGETPKPNWINFAKVDEILASL